MGNDFDPTDPNSRLHMTVGPTPHNRGRWKPWAFVLLGLPTMFGLLWAIKTIFYGS